MNFISDMEKAEWAKEAPKYCKSSNILATSTKVRRLGYLKMILDMFEDIDHYPVSYFEKMVESSAQDVNDSLQDYRNSKGEIRFTRDGASAKPYVELAVNLNAIVEINHAYMLSKLSKVYKVIQNQIKRDRVGFDLIYSRLHLNENPTQLNLLDDASNFAKINPFRLNLFEQIFFLYSILTKDALYCWVILDILAQNHLLSESNVRQSFQSSVLHELSRQIESSCLSNSEKRNVLVIAQRIRKWEKPQVYLEHIILPRINWFLDLDLLDSSHFQRGFLQLTDSGYKLHNILNDMYRMTAEKSTVMNFILEFFFFQIVNEIYNLKCSRFSDESTPLLIDLVEESFSLFRTAAPNSIAGSQSIFYACYKLMLKNRYIIEFDEMKNILLGRNIQGYSLDWYKRENDGSLQRRK